MARLPRNVWVLGAAALLNDVASEMVFPLLPVFVAGLGPNGALVLGVMEGVAELVASVLKWAFGVVSDRTGATRRYVVGGYVIAALARPWFALATAPVHVVAARTADRVGKGVRTAPRDALLAGSVPEAQRGAAFGLHRSMDHLGAAIGPLVAAAILAWWTEDVRVVFAAAVVPGLLAALAVLASREVSASKTASAQRTAPGAWRLLVPVALATLGTASDTFVLYKIGVEQDAPLFVLPLFWAALHVVRTATTTPAGWLADRVDARWIAAGGWLWRAGVFAALSFADTPAAATVLALAIGLSAACEPAEKKLVTSWVGSTKPGTAFGGYHAVVGLAGLPAGLWFGAVADAAGADLAYRIAAGVLLAAAGALIALTRPRP